MLRTPTASLASMRASSSQVTTPVVCTPLPPPHLRQCVRSRHSRRCDDIPPLMKHVRSIVLGTPLRVGPEAHLRGPVIQWRADVVEYAERWASAGKTVIVAALDGTFERKPFNQILQLIPLAEEVSALRETPGVVPSLLLYRQEKNKARQSGMRASGCSRSRFVFKEVLLGEGDCMQIVNLLRMQVLKLRAICSHCHREAAFTHRLGDEKDVEVIPDATQASALEHSEPSCIQ